MLHSHSIREAVETWQRRASGQSSAYEAAALANEDGRGSFHHVPPKVAVGDADIVVSLAIAVIEELLVPEPHGRDGGSGARAQRLQPTGGGRAGPVPVALHLGIHCLDLNRIQGCVGQAFVSLRSANPIQLAIGPALCANQLALASAPDAGAEGRIGTGRDDDVWS